VAKETDTWGAFVETVIKLQTAQNAGDLLTSWGTVSFSRRSLLDGV